MKFNLSLSVIFLTFALANGAGFLSGLFGWEGTSSEKVSENAEKIKQSFKCEDNRLAPRVSFAIVGGGPIRDRLSVPYMAAIGESMKNGSSTWFCGGSLVSPRFVITAAHCLSNRNADIVRLGGTNLHPHASSQDVAVVSTELHPGYKSPESYHDIAILRLATSANLSAGVRPICLAEWQAGRQAGEETAVMGWGTNTLGGDGREDLQKVNVRVFNSDECNRVYLNSTIGPVKFPRGITDELLCAGTPEGGRDACQGDSGGPLVVEDRRGVIRLLGIVSAGAGCGLKGFPGVYVRISSYETWIQTFVDENKNYRNTT